MRVLTEDEDVDSVIQLTGTKLVQPVYASGGIYMEISPGDFVLVEHINSIHRENGRDPVQIRSFTHRSAKIWVDVPPAGTLGVLGDVYLSACSKQEMGCIEATIVSESNEPLNISELCLGPIAAGGPYGVPVSFQAGNRCNTGLIAPGSYKILLPDFDMVKSRWTVNVLPGKVTQLEFLATSQQKIDKVEEVILPDTSYQESRY